MAVSDASFVHALETWMGAMVSLEGTELLELIDELLARKNRHGLLFERTLRALLQRGAPSVPFTLAEVRESRASKGTEAGYGGSRNRYACVARLLAFQTADPKHLDALMPVWSAAARQNSEAAAAALAGAGKRFAHELEGSEEGYQARRAAKGGLTAADVENENVILAMLNLFLAEPDALAVGFQNLVPEVFDVYMCQGSRLRGELCNALASGRGVAIDAETVARIGSDDDVVRQPFFWSPAGMKLFGNHADTKDPAKLAKLLETALAGQPAILIAFLEQAFGRAKAEPKEAAAIGPLVHASLTALLAYAAPLLAEGGGGGRRRSLSCVEDAAAAAAEGGPWQRKSLKNVHASPIPKSVLKALETLLVASTKWQKEAFKPALAALTQSGTGPELLAAFGDDFRRRLDATAAGTDSGGGTPSELALAEGSHSQAGGGELSQDEAVIQSLASFFVAKPAALTAA